MIELFRDNMFPSSGPPKGLTKLEFIATQIMAASMPPFGMTEMSIERTAARSVAAARALIQALNSLESDLEKEELIDDPS